MSTIRDMVSVASDHVHKTNVNKWLKVNDERLSEDERTNNSIDNYVKLKQGVVAFFDKVVDDALLEEEQNLSQSIEYILESMQQHKIQPLDIRMKRTQYIGGNYSVVIFLSEGDYVSKDLDLVREVAQNVEINALMTSRCKMDVMFCSLDSEFNWKKFEEDGYTNKYGNTENSIA